MKRVVILSAAALVVACNTVPAYAPRPIQTGVGKLGFTVSGIASYTRDQDKVSAEIREVLENACGGAITMESLQFTDATSRAGIPHLAYSALAVCVD